MLIKKLLAHAGYLRPEGDEGGSGSAELSGADVVGTGNDARLALLNAINDANDAERGEDFANINDDGSTEPFAMTPSDDNGVTATELERMEAETADNADQSATPPEARYKIKVNGRELELSASELVARAQKVEAADQYLSEAARMRREAEQLLNPNSAAPSQQDAQQKTPVVDRRALVRAIQMGDPEEAEAALAQIMDMAARPQFSAEDLTRTVDERLNFKESVAKFESEFGDILGDPQLRQLVIQKDQQLVHAGDKRPYLERYTAIGTEVRAWRDSLVQRFAPATDPLKEKQQQKASAAKRSAPANSASTKASAAVSQDEGEESVSDVIAAIAKQRGGPQWSRA